MGLYVILLKALRQNQICHVAAKRMKPIVFIATFAAICTSHDG